MLAAELPAAALTGLATGDDDEPQAGKRVGPYRLERELGSGGMGVVWLASRDDGAYQRQVALKLPHAHLLGGRVRGRFRRERDILAALAHPHIARLYDAGVADTGQPFLALEYVVGEPITSWCASRSIPIEGRLELIRQVLAAVGHAHARLVVHRDLKPSNVLVDGDGQVKLLDFGIAKLLADDEASGADATMLTGLGSRLATPDYAAPEQLLGTPISVATDVYAVGLLLFELLAGTRPFAPATATSTQPRLSDPTAEAPLLTARLDPAHAATLRLDSPQTLRRRLAGDLEAIVGRALAVDPAERYASADAFAADLERSERLEPIAARRLGRLARAGRFARRHRLGLGLGTALLLAVIAGVGGVLWQAADTAREARRAEATKTFLIGLFEASDPRVGSIRPRGEITARELIDQAAERIDRELVGDPETRRQLLDLTATIYTYLDELPSARRMAALNVAATRELFPADHPETLDAQLFEVWVALAAGDVDAARAALAEIDRTLSASALDATRHRAEWHLATGDVALALGDLAGREQALERAVALYSEHAPDDAGHGATLANLGELAFEVDRLDAALDYFDRALAASLAASSEIGPGIARIQSRRGRVLTELGRFSAAADAFADAEQRFAATLGADHPTAWRATAGRAWLRCNEGHLADAEALFAKLPGAFPSPGQPLDERQGEVAALRGLCLAAAGQRLEEVAVLLAAARSALTRHGHPSADARRADRALAALAEHSGSSEKAAATGP